MKEAILAFLVALLIGAGVNQFQNAAPPPPPQQPDATATAANTGTAAETVDLSKVAQTSDQTFDADVLKSAKPVLVDFYSDNCAPCKAMTPVIAKLANKYDGVKFLRLDVDSNRDMLAKYSVTSIPTFIVFSAGQRGESFTGVVPKEMLIAALDKTLR
jgi:thioredoxin 1